MVLTAARPGPAPAPPLRPVPTDLYSEQALLGALIEDHTQVALVVESVQPADFYYEAHTWVYTAIRTLWGHSPPTPPDVTLLAGELTRMGRLAGLVPPDPTTLGAPYPLAGVPYLQHLGTACPAPWQAPAYAERVLDAANKRRLITAGGQIAALGYDAAPNEGVFADAERLLFAITQRRRGRAEQTLAAAMGEYLDAARERAVTGRLPGLAYPWQRLTDLTGGAQGDQLIIVGARPGGFKSTLVLDCALHFARGGAPGGLISAEMSARSLAGRALSSVGRVDGSLLRLGLLADDREWARLDRAWGQVGSWAAIQIADDADLTIGDVRALARRWRAESQIAWLGVDYVQLINAASGGREENRTQAVGQVTRGLKQLAKELDIPVLAAAQLSRAVDNRGPDRPPQLSDLRESGSLEQDADLVLFPWCPNADAPDELRLLVAKQREGAIDLDGIPLRAERAYTHLADVTSRYS